MLLNRSGTLPTAA